MSYQFSAWLVQQAHIQHQLSFSAPKSREVIQILGLKFLTEGNTCLLDQQMFRNRYIIIKQNLKLHLIYLFMCV